MSVAAMAAAVLAVHGYANPGSLGVAGTGGLGGGHGSGVAPSASQSPTPSSKGSPSPSASPSASPSGSATPGPLLSSTSYASYTYQLYPGTPSSTARQALAGFSFKATPAGSSVNFTLYISGGGQAPISKTYPSNDHIYFVEANLGDDSGNAEYNFGDDGLIVTDPSGHVVG
ncbi:MAG TPA: hypothetical protein VNF75_00255 [Candidatus Dormibacteraeota bacterium]|nr:hypothetical protein [Candidatus Dormibacteraeota bacterium]